MSDEDRYVTDDYEVIFRPLMDHLPGEWEPGVLWYVEAWEHSGGLEWPQGIAVVAGGGYIHFLFVIDFARRKGVGSLLIEAIANRWPNAQASGAVSEGGEKLVKLLEKITSEA